MEKNCSARHARSLTKVATAAAAFILIGCAQELNVPGFSSKVSDPHQARRWSSPVFTPAHETFGDAAKHFLSIRPKPVQPIDFPHKIHTIDIAVYCTDCHSGVMRGAVAGIPSITICMDCHEDIGDPNDSRIQTLRDHARRGEDLRWQRVYGFFEESHVRFNHAPHIRAGVECSTCHGDVTQMTVAERVVNHTMKFCIDCHRQNKAPDDCLTCHF